MLNDNLESEDWRNRKFGTEDIPIPKVVQSQNMGRSHGYVLVKNVGRSRRYCSKKKIAVKEKNKRSFYTTHARGDAIGCRGQWLHPIRASSSLRQHCLRLISTGGWIDLQLFFFFLVSHTSAGRAKVHLSTKCKWSTTPPLCRNFFACLIGLP